MKMTRSKIQLGLREGKREKDRKDSGAPPEGTLDDEYGEGPLPRPEEEGGEAVAYPLSVKKEST